MFPRSDVNNKSSISTEKPNGVSLKRYVSVAPAAIMRVSAVIMYEQMCVREVLINVHC